MEELKACPFCGGEAEIDFSAVTNYGSVSNQNGEITCSNRSCNAEIGLWGFNPDDNSINPTKTLTDKWNSRAPQSEWISVGSFSPNEHCYVYAYCNDIVSSWIELLEVYVCPVYGNYSFTGLDGEDFPAIVTHIQMVIEPKPPKE